MSQGFRYMASWGGVIIDVTDASVRHGRGLAQHKAVRRAGASLEDTERDPWVCDMNFLFIDREPHREEKAPIGDYETRFDAFNELVEFGKTRTLVHPYQGAVRCKIEGFTHRGGAEGQPVIYCSATFVEDIDLPPIFATDTVQALAGSQSVRASSAVAVDALAEHDLESTVLGDIDTAVEKWDLDPTLTTRQVQLEMARLRSRLSTELDTLDAYSDIAKYPIVREYFRLQWELVRAAEVFSSTTSRIISLDVTTPLPLRIIAARFYGADQADGRLAELLELNPGLTSPALVPVGATLKAYALAAARR